MSLQHISGIPITYYGPDPAYPISLNNHDILIEGGPSNIFGFPTPLVSYDPLYTNYPSLTHLSWYAGQTQFGPLYTTDEIGGYGPPHSPSPWGWTWELPVGEERIIRIMFPNIWSLYGTGQWRINKLYFRTPAGDETLILKPFENNVIRTSDNTNFEIVTPTPNPAKIEVSKGSPIVLYGGNNYYNNGFVYYSNDGNNFNNLNLLATDVLGNPALDANGYVSDARNFDAVTTSGITDNNNVTISGGGFTRYTGLVQHNVYNGKSCTRLARYDLNPVWQCPILQSIYTINGCVDKMETSNHGYNNTPYLFFSTISGATYSGSASEFYQVDYDDTIMNKYMTNFPNCIINSIRVDDKV
jgi:hypothetical protein